MFYSYTGSRLRDLAPDSTFEFEQRFKALIREETPDVDIVMRAANAVDASMALHQSHRIPREIIVDDVPAVL